MQEDPLTQVWGVILLLLGYMILIYLKIFVDRLYPSQKPPRKKTDNRNFFLVKNGKYAFELDQNRLCFKIWGDIIKHGDDAFSKKKIIIHDDFYVKKYLIFLIKNAKRQQRPIHKRV